MVNVTLLNIVGVVICVIGCGLILHYLFQVYELALGEYEDE